MEREIYIKNRGIAVLLAAWFGSFGFHKFYLGHWIQGLFYLAFSWTFIPTVFSILEAIVYAIRNDDEFQRLNVK